MGSKDDANDTLKPNVPRPMNRVVSGLIMLAIGVALGAVGMFAVLAPKLNAAEHPKVAATPQPTPTASGALPFSARCPAVGSVAYEQAVHATGQVVVDKDVTTPTIYVGDLNVSKPPLVVEVKGAKVLSSLVVCGANARLILHDDAMVAGDGNAAVVVQGSGALLVLADGKALPQSYSTTAGVVTCLTTPTAQKPGTNCSYYTASPPTPASASATPAAHPSASKKK